MKLHTCYLGVARHVWTQHVINIKSLLQVLTKLHQSKPNKVSIVPDSSDSQSDGTNSGCEEKSSSTTTTPSKPSSSSNNTIKITNNGHAMKIIVEGGNFHNNGKSLDADIVLNSTTSDKPRPPLLPRPPSVLTTASILKYRGKHLQK